MNRPTPVLQALCSVLLLANDTSPVVTYLPGSRTPRRVIRVDEKRAAPLEPFDAARERAAKERRFLRAGGASS